MIRQTLAQRARIRARCAFDPFREPPPISPADATEAPVLLKYILAVLVICALMSAFVLFVRGSV